MRYLDILNLIRNNPLRILLPRIYAALFTFFLSLAILESLLPFTISIPPIYTADIPLGLFLAYVISYPGVILARVVSADTASLIYPFVVFVFSLPVYSVLGHAIDFIRRR